MQRFFSKLCPVWLWFCQWLSLFLIQFLISNISFLFFFSISTSLFILSTCSYMLLTFSTKALFLLKHVNHSLKKFFLALYNKSLPYFIVDLTHLIFSNCFFFHLLVFLIIFCFCFKVDIMYCMKESSIKMSSAI